MRCLTAAFAFVLVILTACSTNRREGNSSNSTPSAIDVSSATPVPNTPTPTQTKTIDDEAQDYARSFWDKRIARCTSNFYWVTREKGRPNAQQFYECKNEPFAVVNGQEIPARELSDADRLNGVDPRPIEWEGKGTFTYRTCRLHWIGTQNWGAWEDVDELRFRLRRVKGKWAIDEISPNDINVNDVYEINCAFVQKYLKNQGLS